MSWTDSFGGPAGFPFSLQLPDFALHKVTGSSFPNYGEDKDHNAIQNLTLTFVEVNSGLNFICPPIAYNPLVGTPFSWTVPQGQTIKKVHLTTSPWVKFVGSIQFETNTGQKSPVLGVIGPIAQTFEFNKGIFGVRGKNGEVVDSLSFFNA